MGFDERVVESGCGNLLFTQTTILHQLEMVEVVTYVGEYSWSDFMELAAKHI